MAFLNIQKSIFLPFSMIFDQSKPKLAFCNPFRHILVNFQQFLTIPEILANFLSWFSHLSSLWVHLSANESMVTRLEEMTLGRPVYLSNPYFHYSNGFDQPLRAEAMTKWSFVSIS